MVIGHVMQKFSGFENSLLFNIIFSIQMPLFMVTSGYARNYSKPIDSLQSLITHLKKRVLSILVPWATWSLVACLMLWKMSVVSYVETAVFQMEIAFWFLFSLFTIDVIFSIGELVSKLTNLTIAQYTLHIMSVGGIAVLLVIGKFMGLSFLGIKYSCYYTVYYLEGYFLFKVFRLQSKKWIVESLKWISLPTRQRQVMQALEQRFSSMESNEPVQFAALPVPA